jgi:hypothetical protein
MRTCAKNRTVRKTLATRDSKKDAMMVLKKGTPTNGFVDRC